MSSASRLGFESRGPALVILTGAGISAESGVRTFRDSNGLWEDHRIEDVASPKGFDRNPQLVQKFYNARRAQLANVQPNAAHTALAELERKWKGDFLLVTQNVDDLHERAGSEKLIHMHGELMKARCLRTEKVFDWTSAIEVTSACECCGRAGTLRPHIVWFGEMPIAMDEIMDRMSRCDLFVSIGTSGQVYPAAAFVQNVRDFNTSSRRIEINPAASGVSFAFTETRRGLATHEVPQLVRELLAGVER